LFKPLKNQTKNQKSFYIKENFYIIILNIKQSSLVDQSKKHNNFVRFLMAMAAILF
jgi:hypothetical protein